MAGTAIGILLSLPALTVSDSPSAVDYARVLASVNGAAITEGHLALLEIRRNLPAASRDRFRDRLLETLIERRLILAHLKRKGVRAPAAALDYQLDVTRELLSKRFTTGPESALKRLKLDETALREHVETTVAWTAFTRRMITRERLRKYFREHRREVDGTQVCARQILIKVKSASDVDWKAAERKLTALRVRIQSGDIEFAQAAKTESQAASAEAGGDVGFFAFEGRMPTAITRVAFALKDDEISTPFRTSYGVHLVQVTGHRPGDLSLEDVRQTVFDRLTRKLWDRIVADARKLAPIEVKDCR